MKNRIKQALAFVLASALMLAAVPVNATEVTSGPTAISLSLSVAESITVSTSVSALTFTYNQANGTASAPSFNITTNWNLAPGHAAGVMQITWLSSTSAALAGPGGSIPSSEVFESFNGNAPVACTGSTPAGGFGVVGAICSTSAIGPNPDPGGANNRTFPYALSLSGLGTLTPGVYTGSYNVEAFIL